ncbi:hypothetical protein D0860_01233 [Hortaea werneckii]|uniref:DUF155 domain-containing protein n=1 Tax=Hortaea werneckii TaxID=91943 RepID=A0A3M7HT06_HORWE|nr:hypothetical protein D0860_01233 [Hortaea werneckii]
MSNQRSPSGPKRNPTVLVTDTRDQPRSSSFSAAAAANTAGGGSNSLRGPSRPGASAASSQRNPSSAGGTRLISVDNVLQYATDIPSAQRRIPPPGQARPLVHTRTPSGRHPLNPKLRGAGGGVGGIGGGGPGGVGVVDGAAAVGLAGISGGGRTSKTSEKLVLLPETTEEHGEEEEEEGEDLEKVGRRVGQRRVQDEDDEVGPPSDAVMMRRKAMGPGAGKSDAERLPKSQRTANAQLARVTAYCTAQSYKLRSTAQFVRDQHGAKTKLYDDCLYCVYQLPLLGGSEGYRVRSSPVVKNPGGRSVLDEQIEANERREYREGWQGESDEYSVRANEGAGSYGAMHASTPPETDHARRHDLPPQQENLHATHTSDQEQRDRETNGYVHQASEVEMDPSGPRRRESNTSSGGWSTQSPSQHPFISPDAHTVAELFIFSYGVAVLWNFTPNQEKDLLADLTFSSTSHFQHMGGGNNNSTSTKTKPSSPTNSNPLTSKLAAMAPSTTNFLPLMTRPLDESDFETEEFHFQYSPEIEKPRIYNDMITLRTSDHMIKLAMSHAIAQSTKLSFFEERMQRTMTEAQYVPRRLALEGRLGMDRKEVVGLVGRLFEGRVDVNLSSNMLDTPNFFWDSEPTLHPLYQGVREYLEIKPRIQVLNERCRVFLDLAEILSDSIADVKMTRITWIIIVLIILSILVTCTEVFLRFGILAQGKGKDGKGLESGVGGNGTVCYSLPPPGASGVWPSPHETAVYGLGEL